MKVHFKRVSDNKKTGKIPVTMTERRSCPTGCALRGAGCYAENFPIVLHWRRVESTGLEWGELCQQIKELPPGQLWRHNVAGDLPHTDGVIDAQAMRKLTQANKGRRGFTYTHHDIKNTNNARVIADCNSAGFTVNLSAESLQQADALAALNVAPVVVVVPEDAPKLQHTTSGRAVVVCPATYRKDVTCESCGLCAISARRCIVAFPVHGIKKRYATIAIKAKV
jgi:hypothetical protein